MTLKPDNGFLLGKFMPPHNGHVFLCDFARAYCRHLTILVCSLPDDPIPGERRFHWMREMFPDCTVVWCHEILPQEPAGHPDFWAIWRDVVARYAGRPDVVFASESYGLRLATETGAVFVPVDVARSAVPVSATKIRADPFANWRFIPNEVRPYFVKRVCVFGPESTGKSTLAAHLAARFDTVWVAEYARLYTEMFGTRVVVDDLLRIVQGQMASVTAAKRQANRILIEDTDAILTAVWSDMLLGGRSAALDVFDDPADLYLLCDVDVAWADDGTRYFPGDEDRRRFFALCKAELTRRGLTYAVIGGDWAQRERAAEAAIREAFPGVGGKA